jgi:hypothetical protein
MSSNGAIKKRHRHRRTNLDIEPIIDETVQRLAHAVDIKNGKGAQHHASVDISIHSALATGPTVHTSSCDSTKLGQCLFKIQCKLKVRHLK